MNPAMKFAAHERGSARTLVLVPGNRRGAMAAAVPAAPSAGTAASSVSSTPNAPISPTAPSVPTSPSSAPHGVRPLSGISPRPNPPTSPGGEAPKSNGATGARTVVGRAGQKLFGPGAGGGSVYLIRSGCVALFKTLPGRRSICVGLLGPDDVFIQENVRDGVAVTGVTAEVLADATVITLAVEALPRLMAASPELATAVVAGFSRRLTGIQELVEQLLSRDITLRLASVLVELAEQFGEPGQDGFAAITIPMPHKLLARLIGANRVTVTRVITEFRAAGLADSRGRNQLSVDPEKLRSYVRR